MTQEQLADILRGVKAQIEVALAFIEPIGCQHSPESDTKLTRMGDPAQTFICGSCGTTYQIPWPEEERTTYGNPTES